MDPLSRLLAFAALLACLPSAAEPSSDADFQKDLKAVEQSTTQATQEAKKAGTMLVSVSPAKQKNSQWWEGVLRKETIFADNAKLVGEQIALPRDIPVVFMECKEANAYFDSEKNRIEICYQLLRETASVLKPVVPPEHLKDATLRATLWTFYHELGHALIYYLDLPQIREEDAADYLSTLILLESGEGGVEAVKLAALEFWQGHDRYGLPFWDTHSLSKQRFYNMLCLAYGKDPAGNAELVEMDPHADPKAAEVDKVLLPQDRAKGCEYEYQQADKAWDALLAPHLKTPGQPAAKKP